MLVFSIYFSVCGQTKAYKSLASARMVDCTVYRFIPLLTPPGRNEVTHMTHSSGIVPLCSIALMPGKGRYAGYGVVGWAAVVCLLKRDTAHESTRLNAVRVVFT